jgi:hypothetical protein
MFRSRFSDEVLLNHIRVLMIGAGDSTDQLRDSVELVESILIQQLRGKKSEKVSYIFHKQFY